VSKQLAFSRVVLSSMELRVVSYKNCLVFALISIIYQFIITILLILIMKFNFTRFHTGPKFSLSLQRMDYEKSK
jgi:hypothetical protein